MTTVPLSSENNLYNEDLFIDDIIDYLFKKLTVNELRELKSDIDDEIQIKLTLKNKYDRYFVQLEAQKNKLIQDTNNQINEETKSRRNQISELYENSESISEEEPKKKQVVKKNIVKKK